MFEGSLASPASVAEKPSPAAVHVGACISSEKKTVICSVPIATSAVTAPTIAITRIEKERTAISGLGLARPRRHHPPTSARPETTPPTDRPTGKAPDRAKESPHS